MNKKWKDFRLNEAQYFRPGVQHGFDLTDFKQRGFETKEIITLMEKTA